jgi:histidinol-phosphate aminotransferase
LAPEPGFVMYALSAQLQGLQFVGVPLTADFKLDVKSMLVSIEKHKPAITYIAYPNNPTATLFARAGVEAVISACRAVGGLVVIDEAYQPFASDSFAGVLGQPGYEHLLLMRTLSKFGLAGVRLGYLVGAEPLIAQIDKVRPPYNISVLNLEAALFALEHADEFARQAAVIVQERDALLVQLRQIAGLEVFDSQANMILVRLPSTTSADAVFAAMKQRGVLIKNASKMHPLLANCLRLTVGAPDENVAQLAALKAALNVS